MLQVNGIADCRCVMRCNTVRREMGFSFKGFYGEDHTPNQTIRFVSCLFSLANEVEAVSKTKDVGLWSGVMMVLTADVLRRLHL